MFKGSILKTLPHKFNLIVRFEFAVKGTPLAIFFWKNAEFLGNSDWISML